MKWETYLDMAYAVLLLGAGVALTNMNNDWFIVGAILCISSVIPFLKSVYGFSEEKRVAWRKSFTDKMAETEIGEKK